MSSAAVYEALSNDSLLNELGIDGDGIFSNYASTTVPREGRFVVLRWGNQQFSHAAKTGPTYLTVWVHQPDQMGSDYTIVNKIHARISAVLQNLEHALGDDGVSVTSIVFDGLGGELYDPGFSTITRNAGYRVLLRMVA